MIISPDKTKVYLAITKTGSTTVEGLLSKIPGVIVLDDMQVKHGNRQELVAETNRNPLLNGIDPLQITCYGFIRNPMDRFFSACNYLKQFPYALTKLFPHKFTEESIPVPIPTNDYKRRWTLEDWSSLSQKQRDDIRNLKPEDFLDIPIERLGTVMKPLMHWFMWGVEPLRYDDFENETRRLITLFGGDSSVAIPKTNAADDFPASVQYQRNRTLYMRIFHRYQQDYLLLDQHGIPH